METTGQLRRFPTRLKTVKLKQAKPYYRSLKEHCWVSREPETERERMRERGGKRNHAGQSLTLTMCTEMKSLKLNPCIPLALWRASEKCWCSAHVILCYLSPAYDGGERALFPSAPQCIIGFLGPDSRCIFLDHPPDSSRQLAQFEFSLPPSVPRIPPWAVGKVPTTC